MAVNGSVDRSGDDGPASSVSLDYSGPFAIAPDCPLLLLLGAVLSRIYFKKGGEPPARPSRIQTPEQRRSCTLRLSYGIGDPVYAVLTHDMWHVFVVFVADILHEVLVHARHPSQ